MTHATYSSAIADAHNYISWIMSAFAPFIRGDILEVGIGHGSYYEHIRRHGKYTGIDIDPRLVAAASARYPEAHFAVADIAADDFPRMVPPGSFDAVVCCNILEHVQDDAFAVANLVSALRPGAHLLILVPALQLLFNDLDRLAGHLRRYDKSMMLRAIANASVAVRRLTYFNPLGGAAWWANGLIRHDSLDSRLVNRQISVFDRYVLPISRALDPLTRGYFGQSLICIVSKQ